MLTTPIVPEYDFGASTGLEVKEESGALNVAILLEYCRFEMHEVVKSVANT